MLTVAYRQSGVVSSWASSVVLGHQWLSASHNDSALIVVVDTRGLCTTAGLVTYPATVLTGELECTTEGFGGANRYTTSLSVGVSVVTPLTAVAPLAVSQVLSSSSRSDGTSASSTVIISNAGNAPVSANITVAPNSASGLVWRVEPAQVTVDAGMSASIELSVEYTGVAPDEYTSTVSVHTNQARCGGVGSELVTIPVHWSVRIADALLFPSVLNIALSPDSETAVLELFLANFAGEELTCNATLSDVNHDDPCYEVLDILTTASSVVKSGELLTIIAASQHPGYLTERAEFQCSMTVSCERVASSEALPSQSVTVGVKLVTGQPSAVTSTARFVVPEPFIAATSYLWLVVDGADRIGNPVTALDALSAAVTVEVELHNVAVLSLGVRSQQQLANGSVLFTYRVPAYFNGTVTLTALIDATIRPDSRVTVVVEPLRCPPGMTLNSLLTSCVCKAGWFLHDNDTSTCTMCPAGTYQPHVGNATRAQCVPCTTGWYCLAGSAAPTALCPSGGYDCSTGEMRLQRGFWVSANHSSGLSVVTPNNNSNPLALVAAVPSVCSIVEACPADDGSCGAGYTGRSCSQCAPGYSMIQSRCVKKVHVGLQA